MELNILKRKVNKINVKDIKEYEALEEFIDFLDEIIPDMAVEIHKYHVKETKKYRYECKLYVKDDVITTSDLTFYQLIVYLSGVSIGYAIKANGQA